MTQLDEQTHILNFLLGNVLGGKGTFLDVGALDGIRHSNTAELESKGWTGICIEAHPDYARLLKRNRPKSHCIHCAVGNSDKDSVTFYTNSTGSLSSLVDYREKFDKSPEYDGYYSGNVDKPTRGKDGNEALSGPVEVPMRTLDTIISKFYTGRPIDFVKIDIEGSERLALPAFNPNTWGVRVISVEHTIVGKPFISDWAKRHGYHGFADTNLDYILTAPSITQAIRNAYANLDVTRQLQLDSLGVYIP
tara:strand:+ start:56 stop:802 length:747 start_codon:yes stop_codon:yes gene_type:complete